MVPLQPPASSRSYRRLTFIRHSWLFLRENTPNWPTRLRHMEVACLSLAVQSQVNALVVGQLK
jgi:hypothetical protein